MLSGVSEGPSRSERPRSEDKTRDARLSVADRDASSVGSAILTAPRQSRILRAVFPGHGTAAPEASRTPATGHEGPLGKIRLQNRAALIREVRLKRVGTPGNRSAEAEILPLFVPPVCPQRAATACPATQSLPNALKILATPEGLEPPTSALGKPCSIRLSYGATRAVPSGGAGVRKAGPRREPAAAVVRFVVNRS